MGDDLNFAQKFTRTAADGLALIAKMDDPRAFGDSAVVLDMMTTLQRGAKRLRARHIYTSAQEVLTALHHEDEAAINGRINNLGSLVTEYARGLGELIEIAEPAPVLSRKEKWDAARETLNAMLPMANPSNADMLSRLMRAPVTLEAVKPDAEPIPDMAAAEILETEEIFAQEAEIVPFSSKVDIAIRMDESAQLPTSILEEASAETLTQSSAPKTAATHNSPSISLDAMMREVIAEALSVARSVNRTISLSYDMGDWTVTEYRANELKGRINKALSQIIRQSMTNDRVGHIDINLAGEQLHIIAGTTALRIAIDPAKAPAPKAHRADAANHIDTTSILGTVS